jgi:hypothetical protein
LDELQENVTDLEKDFARRFKPAVSMSVTDRTTAMFHDMKVKQAKVKHSAIEDDMFSL